MPNYDWPAQSAADIANLTASTDRVDSPRATGPVVLALFITADENPWGLKRALASGTVGLLREPFGEGELMRAIAAAVQKILLNRGDCLQK